MKILLVSVISLSLLLTGCVSEIKPPDNATWISPGKVMIANFYPGGKAEYPITIHNGKDTMASFDIHYRMPNRVKEDYLMPTPEVQDWIIIADSTPVLMPRETKDIIVTLDMPKEAISPGQKWEFWIGVKDTTQSGTVQTEMASRWLVSMR